MTQQQVKCNERLVIKVRRPSGEIEEIVKGHGDSAVTLTYNKRAFADAKKATADAGRGELLSAEMVFDLRDPTDAEIRAQLVDARIYAIDMISAARERDFNRDIGMYESATLDVKYNAADAALAAFDAAHPDLKAAIYANRALRDAELIQSALNS